MRRFINPIVQFGLFLCLMIVTLHITSSAAAAQSGSYVTVQRGDTLSQIAKDIGSDTATLMRLNNLSSVNHIRIGQVLALPDPSAASVENWQEYIVQPGDSLSVLARDYRVGLARLAEINRISPSQNLYVGQALKLPENATLSNYANGISGSSRGPVYHVVKYGEHLGVIARRYGKSSTAVANANNLFNASLIVPGQRLLIPNHSSEENSSEENSSEAKSTRTTVVADVAARTTPDYSQYPTTTEKWIDVDLSRQLVTAYNGIEPVASFLVSTGRAWTPTVQGTFRIWATTPIQDMYALKQPGSDDGEIDASVGENEQYEYYLEDVEWVQYFHRDFAFHSAYWHNNFGTPASHGCINMRPNDAKWLFEWASPQVSQSNWTFLSGNNSGTIVKVHE